MAIPTETRGGNYQKGLADVKIRDDENIVIRMDEDERIFSLPYNPTDIGNIINGKYRVSLSSDGTKLYSIVPEKGTFVVRYSGMVSKEGELPVPVLVKGGPRKRKDGGTWTAPDTLAFTVLLRVVSSINKRVIIPLRLTYSFEQYKDTNETLLPLGRKPFEQTAKFCELAGLDFSKDSIPFSENVLPFLDDLFMDRKTKFQVTLKDGYVDSMFEMAPELDEE